MRLSKIFFIIIFILFTSCKGDAQSEGIKEIVTTKLSKEAIDFFDKKYDSTLYSLIINESNISDHPVKIYLDCKNEGYFAIHYIPKTAELRNFWKDIFFKEYDFNNIDLKKDDKKIHEILKNKTGDYNIFSYYIKKGIVNLV
ncbi:MAG: hypothetical protein ACK5MD_05385 [Flavobacteriales bacterium]